MNHELQTKRLRLRPFTVQDAEAFHRIWGDPEVIWWGALESPEASAAKLTSLLADEASWPAGVGWLALTAQGSDRILGDVIVQPARFVDGIEIGWHLAREAWGRGYATEAARAVLERTLREGVADPLYAIVAIQNERSLRVVEKLGMHHVRDMEYANLPHRLFAIDASGG